MINFSVKALLSYLSTIAETANSTDDEIIAHRFLIYLGLFMSIGGIVWGTISLLSGLVFQSFIPFGYTLITAVNFIYLYHSKNFKRSQNIQVMISLLLPMMCQISLGGVVSTGGVILWSILTILGGFTFLDKGTTVRWFVAYISLLVISALVDMNINALGIRIPSISPELSVVFFTINIIMISTSVFGLFYYFVYSNQELQNKLRILANTDPLTGLPNRRAFFTKAEIEFKRAKRYDRPFSVLMVDIDFFKNINDTYGHAVGDDVLQRFASLLLEYSREVDILGRYGGEEFIILLPETLVKDIRDRALKIINMTRKLTIHTRKNNFSFTISIGLTQYRNSDEDLSTVLKRADEALYKAKEMGRDQLQEK